MPSADHYAAAIVAAATHTGEDPLSFVDERPDAKFRHYALHALLAVFPRADRTAISAALMAPGRPAYFHRSSLWHVLGDGPHRQGPIEWWDAGVLELTIRAVADVARPRQAPAQMHGHGPPEGLQRTPQEPAPYKHGDLPPVDRRVPTVKAKPSGSGRLESGGYRPEPGTYEAELDDEEDEATTVFDRGDVGFTPRRRLVAPIKSKREMEEDLRRAVLNTAAQTPPPEED